MKQKRFSDEQIIGILKEADAGVVVADLCRRHGMSSTMCCRMRDELLNETLFTSLAHARMAVAAWADDYNAERPHSALGYTTPAAYAAGLRLAASRTVATVANEGDNTCRSLVATG